MAESSGDHRIVELPLPTPTPLRTALLAVPRQGRRWPGAARAAATVAVPGLVGVALGFGAVAAVATLGAFAVVYGEQRPYRVRARTVAVVGTVLVLLATIGAAAGSVVHAAVAAGGSAWWYLVVVAAMTATVSVCAFVVDALRMGAPGAFLMLLSLEIASALPALGVSVPTVAAWTAMGAGTAVVVSVSGAPFRPRTPERTAVAAAVTAVDAVFEENSPAHRRAAVHDLHVAWQFLHDAGLVGSAHPLERTLHAAHIRCAETLHDRPRDEAVPEDDLRLQPPLRRPSVRYRLARAAHPHSRSATIAVRLLVAGPVAGTIAIALGVGRPDWAVITAAMILHQGPDRILGSYRAAHRFIGTVLGLVLLACLTPFHPSGTALVVVLAAAMAGTEMFLVRNYGLAMVFITPLVVVLGGLGAPGDLVTVSRDRFLETVVGVCVALAVMWGVLPRAHRRVLGFADGRVRDAVMRIAASTDARELPELRRDLEFDLHASTTAAVIAAHTEPAWTRQCWTEHRRLHELGYRILTLPERPGP
ncbi:FUSC family protein [Rhodococcus sp. B50]|uniref:FUSC family protein n=1 Tax=Rhodococcus sp. B50 TaxID=2682847 RepID=UPI001BD24BA0|nr:FUSC family protein [Rhodococcus sp. B50]MBS9374241.1 hypothetical protein [Rhodococcus sp. B50]